MCRSLLPLFQTLLGALLFTTGAGAGGGTLSSEIRWAVVEATSPALRKAWESKLDELGKAWAHTLTALHDGGGARRPLMRKASHQNVLTSDDTRDSVVEELTEVHVRGPPGVGLCPSCKVEGRIFYKSTDVDNQDWDSLRHLSIVPKSRERFPTQGVYAIDEYHLGEDMPMVRWAFPSHSMFFTARPTTERRKFWNRHALTLWQQFIKPGTNALDIGTGIGDTSIQMAAHVKGGRVVAFESHPATALTAQAQVLLNPHFNLDVHPVAVGGEDGSVEVKVECDDCPGDSDDHAYIKVPKVQLSSFMHDHYGDEFVRDISFVKVDTEGHDKILTNVLQPLLKSHRPKIWVRWFRPVSKSNLNHVSKDARALFESVAEIGYEAVHPETGVPLNAASQGYIPDMLLLPKDSE